MHAASDELKWLTKYGQSEAITSHSQDLAQFVLEGMGWKCFTAAFRPARRPACSRSRVCVIYKASGPTSS